MDGPLLLFRPATFWGFLTIEIPEAWECIREPEGHWGCYEKDNDTGTVWVDYDVFRPPNDSTDMREFIASSVRYDPLKPTVGSIPSSRHEFDLAPLHKVVHLTYAVEDEGETLLFSWWGHHVACHGDLLIVHLNFVLSVNVLSDRGISSMAQQVDHRLLNAAIDVDACHARNVQRIRPS